ncbi:MAG TPA: acyltransferase [Bacteroidia bacterium]|nr:acyltransferase [Bacteroidia bacterium]
MTKPAYIKSLDGIRGLAVLFVICHHWAFDFFNIPFGWVGVQLFFVLSGFLITRILFSEKDFSFGKFLTRFYVKRALRIFPLYFGFLGLFALLYFVAGTVLSKNNAGLNLLMLLEEFPVNISFLLTYTYNFMEMYHAMITHIKIPNTDLFSHLWSLSVEEQFYIVFPFVIYFLSLKNLKRVLVFILIGCPVLRFISVELLKTVTDNNYLIGTIIYRQTPFQFDALCFGAVLAVFDFKSLLKRLKMSFYICLLLTAGVGIINYLWLHNSVEHITLKGLGYEYAENMVYGNRLSYGLTLINICCALMILCSINETPILKLLESKVLVFIGKISYGIYLFHYPFLKIYRIALSHFFTTQQINGRILLEAGIFLTYLTCLIIICTGSYFLFEIRFLKLKEKIKDEESASKELTVAY